jgi:hypothetical protein
MNIKEIHDKVMRGESLTREEKIALLRKPKLITPKMELATNLKRREIEAISARNPNIDARKLYNLLHRSKIKNRSAKRFKRGLHNKRLTAAAGR